MSLYAGIELPGHPDLENVRKLDLISVPAIRRMSRLGFAIDVPYCHRLSDEFRREMDELEKSIISYIPRDKLRDFTDRSVADQESAEESDQYAALDPSEVDFNVASSEQIGKLLFEVLGVGAGKELKRTKGGDRISTGKAQLRDLEREHPVVPLILAYRERAKLISTYTASLPRMAKFHPRGKCCPVCELPHGADTWRIHSEIVQTRAATGRMASRRPNLQNVPVRTEGGSRVRAAFIASPGCKLVEADFSQIELRMMAHLANCRSMLDVYAADGDIHTLTAMQCFGIDDPKKLDKISHRIPSKCFHPDTEVLTKSGWRRIVDLVIGEEVIQAIPRDGGEVALEWTVPLEVFTQQHPSKQLVHLKNENMDLRVTPDHRMLYWKTQGKVNTPKVIHAVEFAALPLSNKWANAGMLNGVDAEYNSYSAAILRLAVATQADGHIVPHGKGAGIRFAFTRERKAERLRGLLDAIAADYSYSEGIMNGKKSYSFYIRKETAAEIKYYLDDDKTFPWQWLELSISYRQAILDEAEHWDGSTIGLGRSYVVTSAIRKNSDVLSALGAITGRKTRQKQDPTSGYWRTSVKDRALSWAGNLESTTYVYVDEVACLSVPSSFVLVRDGGTPVICGQTANFLCIGEGQRVLTDKGLVPIEKVRKHDLVWDGVEFVTHDGVIKKGIQKTIHYDGLTATQDHEVWTGGGSKGSLWEASCFGQRLLVTGDGIRPVEYSPSGWPYSSVRGAVDGGEIMTYDLLNAGPRHRFTVEGKLVSNCLYEGSPKALYGQLLMAMLILISEHKLEKVPDWLTVEWCGQFVEQWYGTKPEVRAYQDLQHYRTRRYGMVWDLTGRVRLTPELRSYHSWIRAAGERQGGNMADQGTCSALMKLTCGEMNERTEEIYDGGHGDWCWPLLPIHDALMLEAEEKVAEDVQGLLTYTMDNVTRDKQTGENLLRVDIKSDGGLLDRWMKPEEHVWNENTGSLEKRVKGK